MFAREGRKRRGESGTVAARKRTGRLLEGARNNGPTVQGLNYDSSALVAGRDSIRTVC
jgi:hypothetical protein